MIEPENDLELMVAARNTHLASIVLIDRHLELIEDIKNKRLIDAHKDKKDAI